MVITDLTPLMLYVLSDNSAIVKDKTGNPIGMFKQSSIAEQVVSTINEFVTQLNTMEEEIDKLKDQLNDEQTMVKILQQKKS